MKLTITFAFLLSFVSFAHTSAVDIQDVYSRFLPAVAKNGAVYLTLKNNSAKDIYLTSVDSPVAQKVEVHAMVHSNGQMRMENVNKLLIKPGHSTQLKPGGYHIMLLGLKQRLELAKKFPLTLKFSDGSSREVQALVKKL